MMTSIYSVGLYCKYEGGSPFIFFNNRSDAEFLKDFLIRYSRAIVAYQEDQKVFDIFDLSDEFLSHFDSKLMLGGFPYKSSEYNEYEINEHFICDLNEDSKQVLNKISKFGF